MFKKLSTLGLATFLLAMSSACEAQYSGPPADLVVMNANVVTIDKDNPRAEAVAVIGDRGRWRARYLTLVTGYHQNVQFSIHLLILSKAGLSTVCQAVAFNIETALSAPRPSRVCYVS